MERRTKAVLLAMTTTAVVLTATTSVAVAKSAPPSSAADSSSTQNSTPGLTSEVTAQMAAQAPLVQAVDRIQGLAAKDPDSGYTATKIDDARHALTLYWKGEPSAAVEADLKAERAHGIGVTVVVANYSQHEILAEMNRLADAEFQVKTASGDALVKVAPNADYSGLILTMAPGVTTAGEKAAVLALSPDALTAKARAEFPTLASTMPYTVVTGERPIPLSSRQADTTPYYAGGQLRGTYGSTWVECSTGFAAERGTQLGLLTAAHCTWTNFYTGAGVSVGRTSQVTYSYDEQFIPTSAAPDVWDGPSIASPNGAGQFFKPSYATGRMAIGESLCTSGAWSGANCGNHVIEGPTVVGVTQPDGSVKNAELWTLFNEAGQGAVGQGDSGGPVFGLMNNNSEDVDYGLVSSGDPQSRAACNGMQTFGSHTRICAYRFYVSSAVDGAAAMGASIFVY